MGANTIVIQEISSGHVMFGMARNFLQPKLEEGMQSLAALLKTI
jgi:hypothetical protein